MRPTGPYYSDAPIVDENSDKLRYIHALVSDIAEALSYQDYGAKFETDDALNVYITLYPLGSNTPAGKYTLPADEIEINWPNSRAKGAEIANGLVSGTFDDIYSGVFSTTYKGYTLETSGTDVNVKDSAGNALMCATTDEEAYEWIDKMASLDETDEVEDTYPRTGIDDSDEVIEGDEDYGDDFGYTYEDFIPQGDGGWIIEHEGIGSDYSTIVWNLRGSEFYDPSQPEDTYIAEIGGSNPEIFDTMSEAQTYILDYLGGVSATTVFDECCREDSEFDRYAFEEEVPFSEDEDDEDYYI